MLENAEAIAKRIPRTLPSDVIDLSSGPFRTPQIKALLDEAAQFHKNGQAMLALDRLQQALERPDAGKIYLTDWLRFPVYWQYAGMDEIAWSVFEIYLQRRKDWSSQREIAHKMHVVASLAKNRENFFAAMLWFSCCEDRERRIEIDVACASMNIDEKELEGIWVSLAGKTGRLSKAPAGCTPEFEKLRKNLWHHQCSLDAERLHARLQGFAHKHGFSHPQDLTESLIQYRLAETDYSYEAIVAMARRTM